MSSSFSKVCLSSDLRDPFGRQRAGSRFVWLRMPTTSDGGGHTLQGAPEYANSYFSQEESVESSTFRKLLGVIRCLKSMMLLCKGKFVVF
jgi:hypothetical protein